MSQKTDKNQIIPELDISESLQTIMTTIQDKMMDAIERDGIDLETLKIPFPICSKTLERKEFIVYIMFEWIAETGLVIDSLNMILNDFKLLGISPDNFKGNIRTRFYLLIRIFYYEFYKFKETFNHFVNTLLKNKLIDKSTAILFKKSIHDAFKHAIITRHNLVHNQAHWTGREHIELLLVSLNIDRGYAVFDKETLTEIKLQDTLNNMTNTYINTLSNEGTRMRNIIHKILNFIEGGIDSLASRLEA